MAVLVIAAYNGALLSKYDDWDIIDVVPAEAGPGLVPAANDPVRFAFAYITDANMGDDFSLLLEPEVTGTRSTPEGDKPIYGGRKRGQSLSLNGNLSRFTTYHPWGADGSSVPSNVKFTWAQVQSFIEAKL